MAQSGGKTKRLTVLACMVLSAVSPSWAADSVTIGLLSKPPFADGAMGARLAIEDNNTTGKFIGQAFSLDERALDEDGDTAKTAQDLSAKGRKLIVSLLEAGDLGKAAQADALFLNAAAPDEALRNAACRPNLLHLIPDRAMLADALTQYLVKKRWSNWLLITGPDAGDVAFADALRRSAKRFGTRIIATHPWTFDRDSKPESDVSTFTQGGDYDVAVVADESGGFGDLLSYRLWLPRPVAGTQGLVAKGWDGSAEEWGAIQLQNRFRKLANRPMTSVDYAAWLAVRVVGEAAQRAKSTDPAAIRKAILAADFSVAGFKGRQLSFRPWDGQLRQPILLAAANGLIATAPVDGFMHPVTEMDTLGTDRPETKCTTGPRP
ncbi:MAG TPA: ABC transporter substrate-binding protein [Candidatus Sulfotelmatobacter sp.]|jgi:ABC transporter substrate binding protein (PQQ-dependent alcohol dehydrogenase system)|nr:ABC transporter substrate-binding protein [Candidatus Sulfotelmatobacter sp.]